MAIAPYTDTTGPISVSVTLTFPEYLRFNWWACFRRTRMLNWIGAGLVVLYCLSLVTPGPADIATRLLAYLPILLVPGILFVFMPAATYFAALQRWQNVASLREPLTYTFTEDGVGVA